MCKTRSLLLLLAVVHMPPAALHPVDRSFWNPLNLLSFVTFAWAAPAKHKRNQVADIAQKDALDEYHGPPVPRSDCVAEVSRRMLGPVVGAAVGGDTMDYSSAVIRVGKWRFVNYFWRCAVYVGLMISEVYFLQQILEFLQDEVLGLEPSPTHAYRMAAGLVASSLAYDTCDTVYCNSHV
jgi:hypothetical protein